MFRFKSGFDQQVCFREKHTVVNDKCCGEYPSRIPYSDTRLECCASKKLRQPGTC